MSLVGDRPHDKVGPMRRAPVGRRDIIAPSRCALLLLGGVLAARGVQAATPGVVDGGAPSSARAVPDGGAPAAARARVPAACPGWNVAEATVRGSMTGALVAAIPEHGSQVAANYARIFMWDVDPRRDVEPGDRMVVAWRLDAAGAIEIGAARYESQRLGRTLRAYRFRAAEDEQASFWDPEGVEVARRLKAGPLHSYDQITALLKDRPTHKGMDLKTPVGTPVHAPRAGVVRRIDWKLRGNGHCVEVRYDDGVTAKFLHLSATKVAAGARVRPDQVIALSGNTGHSTAPHLHYQLNRGSRVLDPLAYHGTARRQLAGEEVAALKAEIARLAKSCARLAP
jgi:murein DD-endopeptidase